MRLSYDEWMRYALDSCARRILRDAQRLMRQNIRVTHGRLRFDDREELEYHVLDGNRVRFVPTFITDYVPPQPEDER